MNLAMNSAKYLLATAALFSLVSATGCKKDDSASPGATTADPFVQVDAAKGAPVTQKSDPYNRGQKYSYIFATASLDLTTKVGSSSAVSQTMLVYQVPQQSNEVIEAAAKTLLTGIADGQSKIVKILGDDHRVVNAIEGFTLGGNVSGGTGAWDMGYNGVDDIDMKITRSGTNYTFTVSTPIPVDYVKRGGAGNASYPSFSATTQFSLKIPIQ